VLLKNILCSSLRSQVTDAVLQRLANLEELRRRKAGIYLTRSSLGNQELFHLDNVSLDKELLLFQTKILSWTIRRPYHNIESKGADVV
jgi:hypothetical protein